MSPVEGLATVAAKLGASLARIGSEYLLFGGAAVVAVLAFGGLILAPALASYGRPWEKVAAGFLSLFVLAALVLIGIVIGFVTFYYWPQISDFLGR